LVSGEEWVGKTITITGRFVCGDAIMAQMNIAKQLYYMRENEQEDYPDITSVEFYITDLQVFTGNREGVGEVLYAKAYGYFPAIERMVSRIWVRKCNLVAQALGKNIDSSRKCINFTLEEMSVRKMLEDECEKLKKVRKIFNQHNPEKCRSATLFKLTDEHKRLEPTLKRMELLFYDLYDKDIKVPAYYCEKYGYLLPLKAKLFVDISGNTVEEEMVKKNDLVRDSIDSQIQLRTVMVSEVIPSALHPDRVGKEVEKYGVDGVFGDDVSVCKNGVVNHSVLG
jgi:hypothetical protein